MKKLMPEKKIKIRGARAHNLKNMNIDIPKNKLVVVTGLSGSGKSSLAFDTVYAEGQRRYVESLSAYARQFLGQMDKPDLDTIEGLSPAISIDQKTTNKNPRSTVATATEIYDYLRLLYARVGRPFCPIHGIEIASQTIQQMVDQVLQYPERTRLQILSPVVSGRKGEHVKVLENLQKEGYIRIRVDGEMREITDEIILDKNKKHSIEVVVDRIVIKEGIESRLTDSLETALPLGEGRVIIDIIDGEEIVMNENHACSECGFSIDELEPRLFSFNSPFGACSTCDGLGTNLEVDLDLVIPDRTLTLKEHAIAAWEPISSQYYPQLLKAVATHYKINMNTPVNKLSKKQLDIILYGSGEDYITFHYVSDFGKERNNRIQFEGVINNIARRYKETSSDFIRETLSKYMSETACPTCDGHRLNQEALAVYIQDKHISQVTELSVAEAVKFFTSLELTEKEAQIASMILKEINDRLYFLNNVGLNYLTIARNAGTLSGGEAQRIRLATQIGSALTGVLYVLDEPSIGLHQRDNDRPINTLKGMRNLDNTLIVVEHDEETMLSADWIIDLGPGAGDHGGKVVASGTPDEIMKNNKSLTGQYLSGEKFIQLPAERRKQDGRFIEVIGARENNLKDIDVKFPIGLFTLVTGVSGSGKSTLVNSILHETLAQHLYRGRYDPGEHDDIKGLEHIEKVIAIDQSPIGRTPRSNPATYTGVFDDIRDVFAQTNEAKMRGYKKGRFSFNVRGGRCEACRGEGVNKIEMHFLPDVYVPCEVCEGKRYNRETLEVEYKGKTIADVLDMRIEEALDFFKNIPRIKRKLQTIVDVGLGYIKLGQSATTLSGGEAQRVKLASELHKRSNGKNFYILDEPTTGLHTADIEKLLAVLQRLVDNGDTVVVIEHNLDVIKMADHIIDLGPEGGDGGGQVVATGTPEEIAKVDESFTGNYLKEILSRDEKRMEKLIEKAKQP